MSLNNGSHSRLYLSSQQTAKKHRLILSYTIFPIHSIKKLFWKQHEDVFGWCWCCCCCCCGISDAMGVPTLARKMLTIWFELPPSFSTHPLILTHSAVSSVVLSNITFEINSLRDLTRHTAHKRASHSEHFLSVMIPLSQHRSPPSENCSEETFAGWS